MAYKVVHASDVEAGSGGVFRGLRVPLGATAFGVNQLELPANSEGPEHDHAVASRTAFVLPWRTT